MDHAYVIDQLERHRTIFEALLAGLPEAEIRWKPAPEKWCLLEVVCHLYDEERDDFRARLKHVLETPDAPLPPTDPVGWVTARKYIEQDYTTLLGRFLDERDTTVRWLRGLDRPKWTNTYQHPKVGPISASLFLINWVAHDLLHFRQINALRYGHLASISDEPLDYAGNW